MDYKIVLLSEVIDIDERHKFFDFLFNPNRHPLGSKEDTRDDHRESQSPQNTSKARLVAEPIF